MFYIAQMFGIIGLLFLIISFQKNNKNKVLEYQVFSSLFFTIQYFILGAKTGGFMNLMTLIRNIIFKKNQKKPQLKHLIFIIICMIALTICSYDNLLSLMPTLAVVLYSIALWQNNLTTLRYIEILSCILFITYNIFVKAWAGLISTILEIIFVMIAIYRLDIKKLRGDKNE